MSTDYSDVWDLGMESDCCGAGVYLNGICSCCNDHCTPVACDDKLDEECPDCGNLVEWDCTCKLMDVYRDVGMSPSDFI